MCHMLVAIHTAVASNVNRCACTPCLGICASAYATHEEFRCPVRKVSFVRPIWVVCVYKHGVRESTVCSNTVCTSWGREASGASLAQILPSRYPRTYSHIYGTRTNNQHGKNLPHQCGISCCSGHSACEGRFRMCKPPLHGPCNVNYCTAT